MLQRIAIGDSTDSEVVNGKARNGFIIASTLGHLVIVNHLLGMSAVRVNSYAPNHSVLAWAVANGCLSIVERLLRIPKVK